MKSSSKTWIRFREVKKVITKNTGAHILQAEHHRYRAYRE